MHGESQDSPLSNGKLSRTGNSNQLIIGDYQFGDIIGEGTFNKVRAAVHRPTKEKVAIKMIEKKSVVTSKQYATLMTEIKILRRAMHPYIAQLYQVLENKTHYMVVTELALNGQLFERIRGAGRLNQIEASRFLQQILDVLEYIHSLGIAHRDLKPQNLLLDHKSNIKLIDFGLSGIYEPNTKLKTSCGSPCYAAPETILGQSYNGMSIDIWSAGVILYAMCCGFLPFDEPETLKLYDKITTAEYEIPNHCSNQLINLLSRMLCTSPEKRATIEQIRRHPFSSFSRVGCVPGLIYGLGTVPIEQKIVDQMRELSFKVSTLERELQSYHHNKLTTTYYLLLNRWLRSKNKSLVWYYIEKVNTIQRFLFLERYYEKLKKKPGFNVQRGKKRSETDKTVEKRKRNQTTEKKNRFQQERLRARSADRKPSRNENRLTRK